MYHFPLATVLLCRSHDPGDGEGDGGVGEGVVPMYICQEDTVVIVLTVSFLTAKHLFPEFFTFSMLF